MCLPCRNKTPKDQRVLQQQRSVIMNSEDCIAKYTAYRQRRAEAPLLAAAAKVAAAERRQMKARLDADKRAAAQHKRDAE